MTEYVQRVFCEYQAIRGKMLKWYSEKSAQRAKLAKRYRKAKEITRERIMLETMETVLPKVNKVIADEEVGKNFMPFLPINELQKAAAKP